MLVRLPHTTMRFPLDPCLSPRALRPTHGARSSSPEGQHQHATNMQSHARLINHPVTLPVLSTTPAHAHEHKKHTCKHTCAHKCETHACMQLCIHTCSHVRLASMTMRGPSCSRTPSRFIVLICSDWCAWTSSETVADASLPPAAPAAAPALLPLFADAATAVGIAAAANGSVKRIPAVCGQHGPPRRFDNSNPSTMCARWWWMT